MIFLTFTHTTTLTATEDVRREVTAELVKFWAVNEIPTGMGVLIACNSNGTWTVTCERICEASPQYINPAIKRLFGD